MLKSFKVFFVYIFILRTASATLNTKIESKLPLKVPIFEELAKSMTFLYYMLYANFLGLMRL